MSNGETPLDGFSWLSARARARAREKREERREKRYRKIRSPAHEWPPLSGRNETVRRDSYLFPTEVDWNIFYRVGPHPRILLPFPGLPPRRALDESGDARTGSANLADFLWEKWRPELSLSLSLSLSRSLAFGLPKLLRGAMELGIRVTEKRINPRRVLRLREGGREGDNSPRAGSELLPRSGKISGSQAFRSNSNVTQLRSSRSNRGENPLVRSSLPVLVVACSRFREGSLNGRARPRNSSYV